MAQMETGDGGGHGKHKGKKRSKKMSTRVDLTPMVDLAFLLISFFMLTTTLNKPQAMELNMPKKVDNPIDEGTDVADCQVLHILLDTLDQVWYYEGLQVAGLSKTSFAGDGGIRKEILRKQKEVAKSVNCVYPATHKTRSGQPRDFIILIKMLKNARYDNMVNILDEMDITGTKIYAIQDPDPIEIEAIENGGVVKSFAKE